ncbi:pyrimidine-specific ribonucleoside hydrolase RihA-like isoform X2 [Mercenaria mercenaria]|uniref:pyrimidine-specific ribonucleoside hydrolase RihA-like isoform X2 n=1 Tax=Mercenaria mercenaria TaxID=6596 RepID=UPI00234E666E|nr:pyrimidine-specific ribonucleoside hydrolase RihA-like isoform X2 [Mercenaria mercenaria]
MSVKRKKLLIDTDAGVDDAQAILIALQDPDVDVIGITCVMGNADAKQVGLNVLRILKVADKLDIPVFVGCNDPLLGDKKPASDYHGSDGFGDAPDKEAPDESLLQSEHAVTALVRLAKEHEGEMTLVCIGPLTNVAMAIRMDGTFGSRLKGCYIMGGNHEGKGNMTTSAEFNFYSDPEAAYVVLNQLKSPITIVTWETCDRHSLPWEFYHKLRTNNNRITNFLRKVEQLSVNYSIENKWGSFIPCDEVLVACCLNHDVIKTCHDVYATVEIKGQYTWGQMVVDWKSVLKKENNVKIVTDIEQSVYENVLMKLVQG